MTSLASDGAKVGAGVRVRLTNKLDNTIKSEIVSVLFLVPNHKAISDYVCVRQVVTPDILDQWSMTMYICIKLTRLNILQFISR